MDGIMKKSGKDLAYSYAKCGSSCLKWVMRSKLEIWRVDYSVTIASSVLFVSFEGASC